MNYLTKQKFNIGELVEIPATVKRILLIIDEEALRSIYQSYLENSGFFVSASHFGDHIRIAEALPGADLLVIELKQTNNEEKLEFLEIVSSRFDSIPVITVSYGLNEEFLERLMRMGVVGHMDRKFFRPKDLVSVAKTALLNN